MGRKNLNLTEAEVKKRRSASQKIWRQNNPNYWSNRIANMTSGERNHHNTLNAEHQAAFKKRQKANG